MWIRDQPKREELGSSFKLPPKQVDQTGAFDRFPQPSSHPNLSTFSPGPGGVVGVGTDDVHLLRIVRSRQVPGISSCKKGHSWGPTAAVGTNDLGLVGSQ